ncbi:MAG: TldD/PmbA family protein [Defluviitaleaceae bacterium]|nr:TldD/PmbA family protein [Defluviitaleaceae bacterium]
MINRNVAKNVLHTALSTGGDFAEIFIENRKTNNISLINGKLDKAVSGIDYGIGLRIFVGHNAIYTYTNDLSESNLLFMAKNAADAVNISKQNEIVLDFTTKNINNIHPIKILPSEVPKTDIIDILKLANKYSKDYSKSISQTGGYYTDEVQDIVIINSKGLWVEDRRIRTRVEITAVASNGTEKQTGKHAPGSHSGYEFVKNLDIEFLAKDSARIAATMLEASYAPSGKMTVVIDKGFGGVILHEACGHSLEATAIAKGASTFCNMKGKQIASPIVTYIDDGTIPNAWGSINVDDEGTPTQKNILIENGILKTYLVDTLNGLKMGEPSTGSSRRQSYKYAPTSRMTNTYIQAGTDKEKDIISNTEYGLYAAKMGGGSVTPATGEYNFSVIEGYLIENGKITKPVRGASLIGMGSSTLKNIDAVADIEKQGQGMCGSISGSIPTNVGQPMIRVKEMTVGGQN